MTSHDMVSFTRNKVSFTLVLLDSSERAREREREIECERETEREEREREREKREKYRKRGRECVRERLFFFPLLLYR